MGAPIINEAEFAAFVLVLMRVSIVVVIAPIFNNNAIPAQVKIALSLMLTFAVAPQVNYSADMMPTTWFAFALLGLGEIFLGFTLAFMVRLILEAASVAGFYMSMQMGLSMANTVDPQSGVQSPTLGMLITLLMTLIFLYANGHYLIIKALISSFSVAPPGVLSTWQPEVFTEVIKAMAGMYVLAVKICAPVVAVLFCVKVAFGITAKAVPQMNIMFVGIPVYILVGLLVIGFGMPWWPTILEGAMLSVDVSLDRLLNLFAPQALIAQ